MKLSRFQFEGLHLIISDCQPCWIGSCIQDGMNTQIGLRRGLRDQIGDDCVTYQGTTTPVLGNMIEHAVLDLVPFARARWQMTDGDVQSRFIGQPLQLDLPQPRAAPVALTPISDDQKVMGVWIGRASHVLPPAAQCFHRKLRGIMLGADTHPAFIGRHVLNTVGNRFA